MWRAGLQRHTIEEAIVLWQDYGSFLPSGVLGGARGICQADTTPRRQHTCPSTHQKEKVVCTLLTWGRELCTHICICSAATPLLANHLP